MYLDRMADPTPTAPNPHAPNPDAAGASPAIAQWFVLKQEHPDALLFLRMGDFYELFFADAAAAASALDIALTHRGTHGGAPIPMCGVPVHASDAYLSRLIRRGYRVAVAEQMETARGRIGSAPLKRAIVRLVTPGTLTEDSLLEAQRPNLLLALAQVGRGLGAAWLDMSTGLFETAALDPAGLAALLARLDPAEILAPDTLPLLDHEARRGPALAPAAPIAAARRVADAFGALSLDAFGTFSDAEAVAAALALDYVRLTQAGAMPRLSRPAPAGLDTHMAMDQATRGSLELTRARDGGPTLLDSVRRTLTAAGARMVAGWLDAPLLDPAAIARRQDGWGWLLTDPGALAGIRAALRQMPDIARSLARLSVGRATPRDLGAVAQGLDAAALASQALAAGPLAFPPPARDLCDLLRRALADPMPSRAEDGGAIAAGFDAILDAERALRDDSRRVVASLVLDYAQRYGVASLKIRHHRQLGYVIEVPSAGVEALRAHPDLTLRQGMANGARFSNAELGELDRRIAEAAERAATREQAVLDTLIQAALAASDLLTDCATTLARLDVLQSCARLAEGGRWCRPAVTDGEAFAITGGRHPVVEAALTGTGQFVPNDIDLGPDQRVLLLTGPNMAGKSTFLRQSALIAILAQAGLPVPAAAATLGVVDRLFSRVGASDDLARGRSTFMVEMTETAAILNQAGPRSLVIVDEIGRGTSTLDGLAIAWAVLEALHNQVRCRTVFATHFHELAGLAQQLPRLRPHTMRVREWRGGVVFLHEVAAGAAGRSWGVHVAQLAGVPAPTVRRAAALLAALERDGHGTRLLDAGGMPLFAALPPAPDPAPDPVQAALAALDPDAMTARDALAALYQLKALIAVPDYEIGLQSVHADAATRRP